MSTREWTRQQTKPMAKLFKWLMVLFIPLFSLTLTSCGGDDKDEPDNPNNNSSYDLPGTIELAMANTGKNKAGIGDDYTTLYINEENNFDIRFGAGSIASVGRVRGTADIKIPSKGWTYELKVNVGHGYVFHDQDESWGTKQAYYLVYVVSERLNSYNEIIGYNVRYYKQELSEATE